MLRRFFSFLKNSHYCEVFLLSGSSFLGFFFSLESWSQFSLGKFCFFYLALILLIMHVYLFNDWADKYKKKFLEASLVTGVSGIVLFFLISLLSFFIAILITILSILYSHPLFKGKGKPIFSSLIHLLGGSLLFLLGCASFKITLNSFLLSIFFALAFSAGHLIHEIIDFSYDSSQGVVTNAIRFGEKRTYLLSFFLFSSSFFYLGFLILQGFFSFSLIYLILTIYLIYLFFSLKIFFSGITQERLIFFRKVYRSLFVFLGIFMWLDMLWKIK